MPTARAGGRSGGCAVEDRVRVSTEVALYMHVSRAPRRVTPLGGTDMHARATDRPQVTDVQARQQGGMP